VPSGELEAHSGAMEAQSGVVKQYAQYWITLSGFRKVMFSKFNVKK
jgi:hypothetical protein